jgi:hypothetical protein
LDVVTSTNGVPIRLTEERWNHIESGHRELRHRRPDVLETVEDPQRVVQGDLDDLLAVRRLESGRWIVVAYRELSATDGFIVTAYTTRREPGRGRETLWPRL